MFKALLGVAMFSIRMNHAARMAVVEVIRVEGGKALIPLIRAAKSTLTQMEAEFHDSGLKELIGETDAEFRAVNVGKAVEPFWVEFVEVEAKELHKQTRKLIKRIQHPGK